MEQTYPSDRGLPVQQNAMMDPPAGEPSNAPKPARTRRGHLRRFCFLYGGIAVLVLLFFLPPLVNVSRYQRRIATSIANSIGRPVHFDRISLTLLPLPGFTIDNLVVGEDPAFGYEPIIRANSVRATLRLSSLWRRRVEFSTISFTDPSVNLVHAANGQWNIEGILLHASQIETAPTAQRRAGAAPRFPYIEATGARLNIKQEQEKLPFSLVEAEFALWLPDPHQWHLRLRARPTRTDSNASDTGIIELETTLGAAPSLSQTPLNLEGQWRNAQLGEATRVLFGHDAGWRGQMNLAIHIRGTFGESAISTRLQLMDARPADFIPEKPLTTEAECFATATGIFHAFEDLRCSWPPASSSQTPSIVLTGDIPNVHLPREASIQITAPKIPGSTLLTWLRATNSTIPQNLVIGGTLTGTVTYGALDPVPQDQATSSPNQWQGQLALEGAAVTTGEAKTPLLSGDIHLASPTHLPLPHPRSAASTTTPKQGFTLDPVLLQLGGHDPALLSGHLDSAGYTLHLSGMATLARLTTFAQAFPPLGKGLLEALATTSPAAVPFHIDLTATRPWKGTQIWQDNSAKTSKPAKTSQRRHHR